MAGITSDAVRIHGHNFARCHIADERCAHCVQCAGFRSKYHSAVRPFAHAQRPKPVWVAGSDQLGGGGDDQRIRTLNTIHRCTDSRLDGAAAQPLLHDDIGNDLGVGCGMKNGALLFQRFPQFIGVGQIAVVSQSHAALVVVDDQRLHISFVVTSGGGVAHMTDNDAAAAQ